MTGGYPTNDVSEVSIPNVPAPQNWNADEAPTKIPPVHADHCKAIAWYCSVVIIFLELVCTAGVIICVVFLFSAFMIAMDMTFHPNSPFASFAKANYTEYRLTDTNADGLPLFLINPGGGMSVSERVELLSNGFACQPPLTKRESWHTGDIVVHGWRCIFVEPDAVPFTIYENGQRQVVFVYSSLNCSAVEFNEPHKFWSQTCAANRCDQFDNTCEHRFPVVSNCGMDYHESYAVSTCNITFH